MSNAVLHLDEDVDELIDNRAYKLHAIIYDELDPFEDIDSD